MREVSLRVGSRVYLRDKQIKGTVQFIGNRGYAPGKWIRIKLDEPKGENNVYFKCEGNYGIFIQYVSLDILDKDDNVIYEMNADGTMKPISQPTINLSSPGNSAEIKTAAESTNLSSLQQEMENLTEQMKDLTEKIKTLKAKIVQEEEKLKDKKIESDQTLELKSKIMDFKEPSLQRNLQLTKKDGKDETKVKISYLEKRGDFHFFIMRALSRNVFVSKNFSCQEEIPDDIKLIEVRAPIEDAEKKVIGEIALAVIFTKNAKMPNLIWRVLYEINKLHKFGNRLKVYNITLATSDQETPVLSMEEEMQIKYIKEQASFNYYGDSDQKVTVLKMYTRISSEHIIVETRKERIKRLFSSRMNGLRRFPKRACDVGLRGFWQDFREYVTIYVHEKRPKIASLGVCVTRVKGNIYGTSYE